MPREFIQQKTGQQSLDIARRQKRQLEYFTKSEVQEETTEAYLEQWAERKYRTEDFFLTWIKTVFKTENFLSFFKYYRTPNASAKLIDIKIKDQLNRVFFAEDSFFKYTVRGEVIEEPEPLQDGFDKRILELLLFRHNDLIVHDRDEMGNPFRFVLDLDKVVAIDTMDQQVTRIAYTSRMGEVKGFTFIDEERYMFLRAESFEVLLDNPHDLGFCPVEFISPELMYKDDVVRRSLFSYVRPELEEYVFLKTLQRMTEPNGAIPVITKIKTNERKKDGKDKGALNGEPMSLANLGGRASREIRSDVSVNNSKSVMQAGTTVDVPIHKKADGSIDTDLAKNLINFHYLPTEALEYLDKRINLIEHNIIVCTVGDFRESNEAAMNEMQVSKSFVSKQDRLRWLSRSLSMTRKFSDRAMLALTSGPDNVTANVFYGSDFFQEDQEQLYEMFTNSPNPIERNSILRRLSRVRNMFNKEKAIREQVLYNLIPYTSDADFKMSVDAQQVSNPVFQLQTRFDYWVALFEANFGEINVFWQETDGTDSEKLVVMTNLIFNLINQNLNDEESNNGTPPGVQGAGA